MPRTNPFTPKSPLRALSHGFDGCFDLPWKVERLLGYARGLDGCDYVVLRRPTCLKSYCVFSVYENDGLIICRADGGYHDEFSDAMSDFAGRIGQGG